MGIEVAIIHGKEDRLSLPVLMSDIAYPNYCSNPLDSYLDIEAVVDAAKELKCDAVHPGYGFLAENALIMFRISCIAMFFSNVWYKSHNKNTGF